MPVALNPFDFQEYAEEYASGTMGSVDNDYSSSWRTNEIKRLIEPGNGSILDIGCGIEDLFVNLSNWEYEKPYCGVDCNKAMAEKAKELGRPPVMWGELPNIKLNNRCVDDVVCFGVLAYLDYNVNNFFELIRLAKKTVSTNFFVTLNDDVYTMPVHYTPKGGEKYSYNIPTIKSIRALLQHRNFRIYGMYEIHSNEMSGMHCDDQIVNMYIKVMV